MDQRKIEWALRCAQMLILNTQGHPHDQTIVVYTDDWNALREALRELGLEVHTPSH